MLKEDDILEALRKVIDPETKQDIVALGCIKNLQIEGGEVSFSIALKGSVCSSKDYYIDAAQKAVYAVPGVDKIYVNVVSADKPGAQPSPKPQKIPGVKNIIAIASGKGGVGKSTVSVNLAVSLAKEGVRVGLLDLDIYGPSLPIMMGVNDQPESKDDKLVPLESHGVRVMSLGFLVPDDAPLIWRGPMVMGAVEQLLRDVAWGELDYLLIDLPPGTGDAQLSLTQKAPLTGAVIVTTPQDVALLDATKGLAMFKKVDVEVLGLIENMSFYQCPSCGERSEIFSHGGGKKTSEKEGAPFLGEIPINIKVREGGDEGNPVVVSEPEGAIAETFREISKNLISRTMPEKEDKANKQKENVMSVSEEKKDAIIEALNTIRPYLQADGGDVEYVDYVDDVVQVRLKGACGTCPSAMMTLQMGVERAIREKLPEIKGVVAV